MEKGEERASAQRKEKLCERGDHFLLAVLLLSYKRQMRLKYEKIYRTDKNLFVRQGEPIGHTSTRNRQNFLCRSSFRAGRIPELFQEFNKCVECFARYNFNKPDLHTDVIFLVKS